MRTITITAAAKAVLEEHRRDLGWKPGTEPKETGDGRFKIRVTEDTRRTLKRLRRRPDETYSETILAMHRGGAR